MNHLIEEITILELGFYFCIQNRCEISHYACDIFSKFCVHARTFHDVPEPRGKEVVMTCFVDADHAGCKETQRSHTGVIIFGNRAPIFWFSKRQATVKTSRSWRYASLSKW